jgi:hypothetical protein
MVKKEITRPRIKGASYFQTNTYRIVDSTNIGGGKKIKKTRKLTPATSKNHSFSPTANKAWLTSMPVCK